MRPLYSDLQNKQNITFAGERAVKKMNENSNNGLKNSFKKFV